MPAQHFAHFSVFFTELSRYFKIFRSIFSKIIFSLAGAKQGIFSAILYLIFCSIFAILATTMATYQIPAPPPMSIKGDVVENWRDFETSWDYYTIATDLRSKETTDAGKEIVAATLCTVMGPESKKIMNSLPSLTDADKKNPKRIIEELRKYFVPQRNVLYERFVFNSATQKPSETVDEYVVRLRQLANSCEFGDLKDSLIRDRIVIGTSDENGRERLLRERPVPNLDKVVESL